MSGSTIDNAPLGMVLNAGVPALSKLTGSVYNNTETLLTRPRSATYLNLNCEVGTFRLLPGNAIARTFTAAATDLVTIAAHPYLTGDGPFFLTNSGGALPTGLAAETPYWITKIDANTFKLATSKANAENGTPVVVDITGAGTGTHTIGGVPAAPAATTLRSSVKIGAGERLTFVAPELVTVKGSGATDLLTYWWS